MSKSLLAILIVVIILIIIIIAASSNSSSEDDGSSNSSEDKSYGSYMPPSSSGTPAYNVPVQTIQPVAAPVPQTSMTASTTALVPTVATVDQAKVDLYTDLDFGGKVHSVYPGMKVKFAYYGTDKTLNWVYKSMRVVPGTYIMLVSEADPSVSTDNCGGCHDRAFALGKFDVANILNFIKSYTDMYDQHGLFMDRDYWPRGFFLYVLPPSQWDSMRKSKHDSCMSTTVAWGYDAAKGADFCKYALPETSDYNITVSV